MNLALLDEEQKPRPDYIDYYLKAIQLPLEVKRLIANTDFWRYNSLRQVTGLELILTVFKREQQLDTPGLRIEKLQAEPNFSFGNKEKKDLALEVYHSYVLLMEPEEVAALTFSIKLTPLSQYFEKLSTLSLEERSLAQRLWQQYVGQVPTRELDTAYRTNKGSWNPEQGLSLSVYVTKSVQEYFALKEINPRSEWLGSVALVDCLKKELSPPKF